MAHDVFVSHSVKDKAAAETIVAYLERDSIRCWVAPRDVVPGADWGESIIDAIESSRVMVLIFSAHANSSSQIKREVERAVDKDVYTIPLRIEDIEPTRSLEYFISTSQWMDAFPPPLEPHLEKLSRTVKAIIAKPSPERLTVERPITPVFTAPDRTSTSSPPPLKWLKIAAAGVGLIVLCGIILYLLNLRASSSRREKRENFSATTTAPAPAFGVELNKAAAANGFANQAANQPAYNTKGGFQPPPVPAKGAANISTNAIEEPAAVVGRYYDDLSRGELAQAYDCFSQSFKASRSYDQFAQIFSGVRSISLERANEAKRGENEAEVNVAFTDTDAQYRNHQWAAVVSLVKEGDAWRLSRIPAKKEQPPAPAKN